MLLQARDAISQIFQTEPAFLFDMPELYDLTDQLDIKSYLLAAEQSDTNSLSSIDNISADVVYVITNRNIAHSAELTALMKDKNLLQIPAEAFDGRYEATRYTLEMCRDLDLDDCVARNVEVIDRLATHEGVFSFESDVSDLEFTLYEDIRMMRVADTKMLVGGNDLALSSYTEVALIPHQIDPKQTQPRDLGYNINGTFNCDGCLVATHYGIPSEVEQRKGRVCDFVDALYSDNEFPLRVTVEASQVRKIVTRSGRDVSTNFLSEMDSVLAENVIELAVGTNAGANPDTINWRYNSPINESALGFHIAIGDGARSPHVDFICCSAASYGSFMGTAA